MDTDFEATVVLLLVLTLILGGMMLALVMGYRSIEESRAAKALRPSAPRLPVAMARGLFVNVDPRTVPQPLSPLDEALLARLEQHLKAEHAAASQFVHFPSLDSLYQQSGSSLHVH